ncbi:MAG: RND family transporter [Bacteroidia bacterium]
MQQFPRSVLLLVVGVISLLSFWQIQHMEYRFEVEGLFPKHSESLRIYEEEVAHFESQKAYQAIGIEIKNYDYASIFQGKKLRYLEALTTALDELPQVVKASSLTTLQYQRLIPFIKNPNRHFFHPQKPERYSQDSSFFFSYPDVREKFLDKNSLSTCIYLELKKNLSSSDEVALLDVIHQLTNDHRFYTYHLNGHIQTDQVYQKALKEDFKTLSIIALLLIILTLTIAFRSFWGLVLSLLVVLISVLWTMGSIALLGFSLNTMTILIPTVVGIVALSDVIHILSRYRSARREGLDVDAALKLTFQDIGQAILLTSVTTAIGFASLMLADIEPIIQFGIGTAIGVMWAYALARFVLPVCIRILPERFVSVKKDKASWHFQPNRYLVILAAFIAIGISSWGVSKLKIDSKLYDEIAGEDAYSSSLRFFDSHFGGIRTVEILLKKPGQDSAFFQYQNLQKLDKLERYLLDEYGINTHYSILTQFKRINRTINSGRAKYFRLPETQEAYQACLAFLNAEKANLDLQSLIREDGRSALVRAQIADIGSNAIHKKDKKLKAFLEQTFPNIETHITGRSALVDSSNRLICKHLLWGLAGAMLLIGVIIAVLFKSVITGTISLIVNTLPLFITAGLLGILGISLNMSTAIIFTIGFGIAVDDTIHFLSRLRTESRKTTSQKEAISRTLHTTGKAIGLTSFVLIAGFGVLMFSSFESTRITGMSISLTLLSAVFADLFLLPVLLGILRKPIPHNSI